MKDCQELYLKCNVLLLAYAFEKSRNINLKNYGLCPRFKLKCNSENDKNKA